MIGILGWLMFGSVSFHKKAIDDTITAQSYNNAKKNGNLYYYDSKGHKYMTDSDIQVYNTIEYIGNEKHEVLKSVKYGCIIRDLTKEKNNEATLNSKKKAIEEGKPVYRDYNKNIWRDVNNYNLIFSFTSFCGYGDYYFDIYKQIIYDDDKKDFVHKKHGTYYVRKYKLKDKDATNLIKTDWRGFKKLLAGKYNSYYEDIDERKVIDDDGIFYVMYSVKDDTPWGLEYKDEDFHRFGIKRMWRLYENKDGTFIRERKWYHEGASLNRGRNIEMKGDE